MSKNSSLRKADKAKNDEFYTQLADIEKELKHYKTDFFGKTVFCKGLAKGLGIKEEITSPTFTIMNIYKRIINYI